MKIPSPPARAAALFLTVLLSSSLAPAAPQRRAPERRARRAPAPSRTAPPAQPPARPAAQAGAPARPASPTGAAASPGRPAAPPAGQPAAAESAEGGAARARAAEDERQFEEMLGADAYGVYFEVRRVASLFDSAEVKTSLGAAALFDQQAAEFLHLANFVEENSEALAEARVAAALLPTRADLPTALVAVRLSSPEAARLFEPKFRAFVADRRQSLGVLAEAPARGVARARSGRAGRRGASAASRPAAPAAESRTGVRRVGSWLLAAERPFTLRRLGGGASGSLADSARFQNLRTRFAKDSVFVYFDTERTRQGWEVQTRQAQEAAEAARQAGGRPAEEGREEYGVSVSSHPDGPTAEDGAEAADGVPVLPPDPAPPLDSSATTAAGTETASAPPSPETTPADAASVAEGGVEGGVEAAAGEEGGVGPRLTPGDETGPPAPPTEAQVAGRHFGLLLAGLLGGVPRLPGAVAAGLSVEGDSMALRVGVENAPNGPAGLIPFLPNLVAGPPVPVETSAAAPASNGLLFATTFDWEQIFDLMLGTSEEYDRAVTEAADKIHGGSAPAGDASAGAQGTESGLAFVEKVLGFSFRRDLLPALGNEVAISMPLDILTRRGGRTVSGGEGHDAGEEKAARAGFVVLVTLNDPERVRPLLPKLALLLGGAPAPQAAEKRAGYEINSAGPFAYAVLERFLVVSDVPSHVRHAVDSYARGETLAQTNAYRDSTAWQAPQRLAHAYVSDELMAATIRETKRMAEGSEDPLVISTLPQLDLRPEAISFAATDEGDLLVHELRVPVSLGRVYAAAAVVSSREAPNVGAEAMVSAALDSIYLAQLSYKGRPDRDRYATLEELIADGLVEKSFVRRDDYKIELTALGDRFEVTATPLNYGKAGRRSFYLDQSGVVRGADHKGGPATAEDPPVN